MNANEAVANIAAMFENRKPVPGGTYIVTTDGTNFFLYPKKESRGIDSLIIALDAHDINHGLTSSQWESIRLACVHLICTGVLK